jgi:hypothetical protein
VIDANGQALAYVYGHADPPDAGIAKVLTEDEARRIASKAAKPTNSRESGLKRLPSYGGRKEEPRRSWGQLRGNRALVNRKVSLTLEGSHNIVARRFRSVSFCIWAGDAGWLRRGASPATSPSYQTSSPRGAKALPCAKCFKPISPHSSTAKKGWDFVTQSPAGGLNPIVLGRCV